MMKRILGGMVLVVSLCAGVSQAANTWFCDANSAATLAADTGQAGDAGARVAWRDTEIKPTDPTQVLGGHDELGVIRRQSAPDLQAHALFSFTNLFGGGAGQVGAGTPINEAKIWLYVVQNMCTQTITIAGLAAADADWDEGGASYDYITGTTSWSGGTFSQSVVKTFGTFENPSNTGWFAVDITDALREYQTNGIGGIALLSDSEASGGICNFYFASDEYASTNRAPGVWVSHGSSYTISTNIGPGTGGNSVTITNQTVGDGSDITNVLVGGTVATISGQGVNWVTLILPAHAEGGVDIVVQSASVGETTFAGAYTYNPVGVIGAAGNPAQRTIAGGYYHSLGLKLDGTVACWGNDDAGQCAVPDPNANFVSVGVGRYHSLGVKADGTVVGWGDNGYGQSTPPDPNAGFVAADGGRYHSVAVRADGTVAAWGRNNYSQCDVPEPNTNFVAVAGGYYHCAALKSDGSIVCWGNNGDGQCDVPDPNTNFVAVAAGYYHSAGLKSDGTVVCWGSDGDGQCTVPAPNANFTSISAGLYHTLGLKADGTIVCWGDDEDGQCEVPAPNENFGAVARGYYHSLGVKADGSVVCWGYNDAGQCEVPAPNSGFSAGGSSGIAPSSGSITGGYAVTIVGTNLCDGADVTNVTLCGVSAQSIGSPSATQVVIVAAAGPMGRGDVRVYSTSFGETIKSNAFTYTVMAMGLQGVNGEPIASGEAASAAKGTEFTVKLGVTNSVSLTLTNLGNGTLTISGVSTGGADAAQFRVESYPASLGGYGAGVLAVASEGLAVGVYDAALTIESDGTNSPYLVNLKSRTYQMSAGSGPAAGGNLLTITYAAGGSGDITNVLVDGVSATIDGQADGWVRIVMPAHADGVVSIVVQGPSVNATLAGAYTYNPAGWIGGPRVDAWAGVPGLPTERMAVGGALHNGALYVVGGRNNSGVFYSTNVFMFDGANWTETVGLPQVCSYLSCATYAGEIYAMGGLDNVVGYRTNVLKYGGGTWIDVAGLPEAFAPGGGSAALGSRLYHAPGGTNVYAYDGTNWTGVAGLPRAWCMMGLVAFDGALYSVGGQAVVGGDFCTNVYRFDGTDWTEVAGLPQARRGVNCVTTNGALLVIGGHDGGGGTTNVFRFDGTRWTELRSGYPQWINESSAFGEINGLVYGVAGSNMTNVYAFPITDSGVSPSSGSAAGGFEIEIVGDHLGDGADITNVTICGVSVASIVSQSATRVVVTAAAGAPGLGDVRVFSTSFGETVKANAFEYTLAATATLTIQSPYGVGTPTVGVYTNPIGSELANAMSATDTRDTTQYICAGWAMSGNEPASGSGTQVVMTVTNDATLTWLWTTNYRLTTAVSGPGSVLPATGWQSLGSNVEITATADPYYHFTTWTDDAMGDTNPLILLMDAPKWVTANFLENMTTNKPTPEWWLAQYGLTNFEADVLLDGDGDGVPSGDEYVMNTDPTNGLLFLYAAQFGMAYGTNCWDVVSTNSEPPYDIFTNTICEVVGQLIGWPCATDRVYDVEFDTTFPLGGWAPVAGLTDLVPESEWLVITNTLDGSVLKLYRLTVRLPGK